MTLKDNGDGTFSIVAPCSFEKTSREEALKLADEIDNFLKEEEQLPWGTKQVYLDMASTMIRRLVEELDKKTKPLSDEEILQFRDEVPYSYSKDLLDFARAIEERHGIK